MSAGLRIALCGALLGVVSVAAHAGDRFERKAGLWKVTMQGATAASRHSSDICLAADTDARLARQESAMIQAMCSKLDSRKVGAEFVTDSVCKIGARTNISHTVTTPDGDGAYRTVITTRADPSSEPGKADKVTQQEGHWAGACPADMKPGDQIVHTGSRPGGGMKMNVLESAGAR